MLIMGNFRPLVWRCGHPPDLKYKSRILSAPPLGSFDMLLTNTHAPHSRDLYLTIVHEKLWVNRNQVLEMGDRIINIHINVFLLVYNDSFLQ